MDKISCDVLIIGGGLTGLMIAYLLRDSDLELRILEARDRLGGRIFTKKAPGLAPVELGATWLGEKHQHLVQLLNELELPVFPQHIGPTAIYEAISTSPHYLAQLPPNPSPSLRIAHGSSSLIQKLAQYISPENIDLNTKVERLTQANSMIMLHCNGGRRIYQAAQVISTLPPNLFLKSITCQPVLPEAFSVVAAQTHTWMGESIKVALTYDEPFWRGEGLSGTLFSNVGPISEMYDHSTFEDDRFALKGFLSGSYWNVTREERLKVVLAQLRKYYGEIVNTFSSYEESVWRMESETYVGYEQNVLPHQNNGHAIFHRTYMDGKLFLGGSETAMNHPGYMEGAIASAQEIVQKIIR